MTESGINQDMLRALWLILYRQHEGRQFVISNNDIALFPPKATLEIAADFESGGYCIKAKLNGEVS